MDRVKRGRVTVIMLDGAEVEGEYRMPPPLADRFAFERHFGGSYSRVYAHFVPVLDEAGEPVLVDDQPAIRMDPLNPIPAEWDAFLVYQQLHRQGLATLKFEQWAQQLDEVVINMGSDDPAPGAGEEEAHDLDPPVLTAPLG